MLDMSGAGCTYRKRDYEEFIELSFAPATDIVGWLAIVRRHEFYRRRQRCVTYDLHIHREQRTDLLLGIRRETVTFS